MIDKRNKTTIREHLNSAKRIQIARNCVKSLAKLLGCEPNSVKIEGNISYIDFKQNKSSLTIPFNSVVWQMANKIVFTGVDYLYMHKDLSEVARQLCTAGYEDAKDAIAACCIRRKNTLFDIVY